MNRKLYVTNIPLHFGKEEIENLFSKHGDVVSVSLIVHADGSSKGFAFVQISGDEAAVAAITALNGFDIKGVCLSVSHKPPKNGWFSPRERRKSMQVEQVE